MRVRRGTLLVACLIAFSISLLGLFSRQTSAATGINQQLSFEGKIVTAAGLNIADGTYNMEFKIYQDGNSSGTGSTLKWTEDRLISASNGVVLTSGTFQVNLGSVTAFGGSVNWNQDTLWLSLQIGNTLSCTVSTTFQSNCGGDGEMTPYIRLTSTPYALNANQLGGISSSGYIQNTTSTQTANVNIQSAASGSVAAVIQGASGQTADILQVKDNAGTSYIQLTTPNTTPTVNIGVTGSTAQASNVNIATSSGAVQTVTIGSTNGASTLALQGGTGAITAETVNSAATVGSELFTSGTCTGTNWSGTGPWTHTSGSLTALTCTPPASVTTGATYQIIFDTTGIGTADNILPNIGGVNGALITGGNVTGLIELIKTTGTASLIFQPDSTFTGTIANVSIKLVTTSNNVLAILNSNATSGIEIRSGGIGLNNTFVGTNSGSSNTTGTNNAALGLNALQYDTTGGSNTAVGYFALHNVTTGSQNIAVGTQALQGLVSGSNNVVIGYQAEQNQSTGNGNVAIGGAALQGNQTGGSNVAIGSSAGTANTTGSNNTYIGTQAGNTFSGFATLNNLNNGTAIGGFAQVQENNAVVVGYSSALVGINTTSPTNTFSVSPIAYSTGTACQGGTTSCNTSGTLVTGTGTTWTAAMLGDELIFANGDKSTVTAFNSATSLTVSTSATEASQAYRLHQPALQVTSGGNVGIGKVVPTANLQIVTQTNTTTAFLVQNASSTPLNEFNIDTTNNVVQIGSQTTDATTVELALDRLNTAADPGSEVDGAMYYNTNLAKFRCGESGVWVNCIGASLASANTAASGTLNGNTTTIQNFSTNTSIPANYCVAGRAVHIMANGVFTTVATAESLTFTIRLGATTIGVASPASTPTGGVTNQAWGIDYTIICDAAVGASVNVTGEGRAWYYNTTSTSVQLSMETNAVTGAINTSGANTANVSVTFAGTASASNTITLEQLVVQGI